MRTPILVPISGLVAALAGFCLLLASERIDGLFWYAIPITLLGMFLLFFWFRPGRRAADDVSTPLAPGNVPGPWYPFALLGIGGAFFVWLIYWTKIRAH